MPRTPYELSTEVIAKLREAVPDDANEIVEIVGDDLGVLSGGGFDCIVITTALEWLDEPLTVLRASRRALRATGTLVCGVGNFTDRDLLVQLVRSDPQSGPRGVIAPGPQHVHGYATAMKTMLEAGLSADIVFVKGRDVEDAFMDAAEPLLTHLGVDRARAARHLGADFYVMSGRPIQDVDLDEAAGDTVALTFAVCVNDDLQLHHNLLASPPLVAGSPHEVLQYRGMSSAAQGLNQGINAAGHELVVLIQQDIYIPSWWPARLLRQWRLASERGIPAIGGPVGVRYRQGGRTHVGHAIDRESVFRGSVPLPAEVDGLDELTLVVARDVPLRFEPALGWHLYGTDFALQARAAGLRSVVLDIPCVHNSLHAKVDDAYHHAEAVLATRWPRELPIFTNTSQIDDDPRDVTIRAISSELEEARRQLDTIREELNTVKSRRTSLVSRWRARLRGSQSGI